MCQAETGPALQVRLMSVPLTSAVGGGWVALAVGCYRLFARRTGRTPT